jgi:hypothetical protein
LLSAPRLHAIGSLLAAALVAADARAEPQVSAVLTTGAGDVQLGERRVVAFELGARADVLFLRTRDGTMGVGPFVGVGTEAFNSLSFEGGIDWLVPVLPDLPFVLSAGAFDRRDEGASQRGVLGELQWGAHPYSFEGHYDMAFGLFLEARYALDPTREADVIGGVAIDLSVLGYPFLLAYQAITR